jgi:hypothetical protein
LEEEPQLFADSRKTVLVWKQWSGGNLPNFMGAWATGALNYNVLSSPHRDKKDFGLCWIIPFGDFDGGGDLLLDDLNIAFKMKPGCAVAFRSSKLLHSVTEWTSGDRFSLVLFTHNEMVNKPVPFEHYPLHNRRKVNVEVC